MSIEIKKNYYSDSNAPDFSVNSVFLTSLHMAIQTHLTELFFQNDPTRIIYSTTDYAFRKRSGKSPWNSLMLPFCNYHETDISSANDRSWKNFHLETNGIYIPEVGQKVRITPITVDYDCTLWYPTVRDSHYAMLQVMFDDVNETSIEITISLNNVPVKLYGMIKYNWDHTPNFEENEWLVQNKISAISLNMSVQSVIPKIARNQTWGLVEKVVFNFGRLIDPDLGESTIDETVNMVLNHFTEEEYRVE